MPREAEHDWYNEGLLSSSPWGYQTICIRRVPVDPTHTSLAVSKTDVPASFTRLGATFSDHSRLERQAQEVHRERLRTEQRKDSNSPGSRICAWEELHGLRLPADPAHPVLIAIANRTRLSVVQIREEQTTRAMLVRADFSSRKAPAG
jgi:hypothetical protein